MEWLLEKFLRKPLNEKKNILKSFVLTLESDSGYRSILIVLFNSKVCCLKESLVGANDTTGAALAGPVEGVSSLSIVVFCAQLCSQWWFDTFHVWFDDWWFDVINLFSSYCALSWLFESWLIKLQNVELSNRISPAQNVDKSQFQQFSGSPQPKLWLHWPHLSAAAIWNLDYGSWKLGSS